MKNPTIDLWSKRNVRTVWAPEFKWWQFLAKRRFYKGPKREN